MSRPVVSVVIPAYHCAGTIRQAIDSALEQNVALEIIVVDDCSGDGLEEVMESYAGNPVISYVQNEKNLGASGSRNRGVSLAKGEYVAFLDADDWWDKDKLRLQLDALKRTGCVLCATARELAAPDGTLQGRVIPVKEEIAYRDLLFQNSINCSSVVARREVLREFPMEHEEVHEDYLTWLKILKKYQKACAVNQPLLKYRLTATGKSGGKLKSAKMTYATYRCIGFGRVKASLCFISYALHGLWKYGAAARKGRA